MSSRTIDTIERIEERAILVSLITDKGRGAENDYSLQELVRLSETAGVEVIETMTQNKGAKDPKWFIGKGKVEELKERIEQTGANSAIFDQELSGAQVRNLEQALDVKIIDRTQLILDIFAQRAKTREGNIQVELAQLSYLLPRLSGQGHNLSRLGGGIGTRGPGETKLETDRRHIRGRIGELKAQLQEVVRHRTLHRERRKKTGVFQTALVGYTNAGKSTLLKRLTDADVLVEDQLFATLDPVSRTLELPGGKQIVITDTVGFIQNLPHDLVAAFRATLEEVCEADLILHVVDSFSEMREEQMKVVGRVLEELGAHQKEHIILYNKIDLCTPEQVAMLPEFGEALRISAYRDSDLDKVKAAIEFKLTGGSKTFVIPADKGDVMSLVYRVGEVTSREMEEENVILHVRTHAHDYEKVKHRLAAYERG
jgi:GTP-binding protein HflX